MKRLFVIGCAIVVAATGAQTSAIAQDSAFSNFAGNMAMNQMMGANLEAQLRGQSAGRQQQQGQRPQNQTGARKANQQSITPPNENILSFRPSMSVRRQMINQFVAKARRVDPAGSAQLAQYMANNDVIAMLQPSLQTYGLRVDNMADAYALWWINAWQAYSKDFTNPSRQTVQAVKAQAVSSLLTLPLVETAPDQIKQQYAEDLLLISMVIEVAAQRAKTDPAYANVLRQNMIEGSRPMGLDFSRMRLTENGFVPIGADTPRTGR
jgi:hypothetical protein